MRADGRLQDDLVPDCNVIVLGDYAARLGDDCASDNDVDGVELVLGFDEGLIRPQDLVDVAPVDDLPHDLLEKRLRLVRHYYDFLQHLAEVGEQPLPLER